jgi:hypothetical protein
MTLIFGVGSSDVHKNASRKGLTQTVNFLRRTKYKNVFVINVSCTFDQNGKSYINEEVKGYNRKMSQIT